MQIIRQEMCKPPDDLIDSLLNPGIRACEEPEPRRDCGKHMLMLFVCPGIRASGGGWICHTLLLFILARLDRLPDETNRIEREERDKVIAERLALRRIKEWCVPVVKAFYFARRQAFKLGQDIRHHCLVESAWIVPRS